MLIEQSAYANRWRTACPGAKALFALGGFIAVFSAGTPVAALAVAGVLLVLTVVGAGVPLSRYVRVALPAVFFLSISCLSLAVSVASDSRGGGIGIAWAANGLEVVAHVAARSLGALAALLFLVLTTPLIDLMAVLRRLKVPEVLLELMVLCYRMLFVFSEALHDTLTAQAARMGYSSPRRALRSLGDLAANLAVQVWQRAQALHRAALARNNDGPLRFLAPVYAHARRDTALALASGVAVVILARVLSA